ncbi:MAG: dienelactone hydrolase family protein [Paracoccaceae bacterium]|nr:dienelactone hydrolase family protein [Paracoccaceae bacterium]
MRLILACLLALTFAPTARAEMTRHRIEVGGLTRHFLLYVPASLPEHPGPRPLVVVLHGGGGTDAEIARATRHRFEALAEQAGFLVLYPDAIGRMWDTGEGEVSAGLSPRRDDLSFLKAAVTAVEARYPVDRSRLFATGISRGGHMSYLLACRAPGMFRAIAPVAMTLPAGLAADCAKAPPTGFLLIEGTADPLVPYKGGRVTVLGRQRDTVLSADATIAAFARINRCAGARTDAPMGAVDRIRYSGCAVPTGFDRVKGGGHTWPSGRVELPRFLVGRTNEDISGADEIWAFFARFPARG